MSFCSLARHFCSSDELVRPAGVFLGGKKSSGGGSGHPVVAGSQYHLSKTKKVFSMGPPAQKELTLG